jgi:hypothetical protein
MQQGSGALSTAGGWAHTAAYQAACGCLNGVCTAWGIMIRYRYTLDEHAHTHHHTSNTLAPLTSIAHSACDCRPPARPQPQHPLLAHNQHTSADLQGQTKCIADDHKSARLEFLPDHQQQ